MVARKKSQDRDERGETRQKYILRIKAKMRRLHGDLPPDWDLIASWPNGLNKPTWAESTHFWYIQELDGSTAGEKHGKFRSFRVEHAYLWVRSLAAARTHGWIITSISNESFSVTKPVFIVEEEPDPEPKPDDPRPFVRCNEACVQFNKQALDRGLPTQKPDSFRRWLSRAGVRKRRVGRDIWHDVGHINERLQERFGEDAPTVIGSPDAPRV